TAIHIINQSVIVPPGGYVVLGADANPATNGGVNVDYQYAGVNLSNASDYLAIQTNETPPTIIDKVSYTTSSGLNPNRASRNLDPSYLSASTNDTDTHWCAATSFINGTSGDKGTPGAPNDPCP